VFLDLSLNLKNVNAIFGPLDKLTQVRKQERMNDRMFVFNLSKLSINFKQSKLA
jgi:hypothetical protein